MAKFQFKLEAVEMLKKQNEQKALEELGQYQRNFQEKIDAKRMLQEKKQKAFVSKNELLSRDAGVVEIRGIEDYISGLNQQLQRADQAIVRARRFLEQAMRQYIQARKEKKMIDRLHEKELEAFRLEQAKLEQKKIDDLISVRARLNNGPIENEEEIA